MSEKSKVSEFSQTCIEKIRKFELEESFRAKSPSMHKGKGIARTKLALRHNKIF